MLQKLFSSNKSKDNPLLPLYEPLLDNVDEDPLEDELIMKQFIHQIYDNACECCMRNKEDGIHRENLFYDMFAVVYKDEAPIWWMQYAHPVSILLERQIDPLMVVDRGRYGYTVLFADEEVQATIDEIVSWCHTFQLKIIGEIPPPVNEKVVEDTNETQDKDPYVDIMVNDILVQKHEPLGFKKNK
jgi:hypothetical protein